MTHVCGLALPFLFRRSLSVILFLFLSSSTRHFFFHQLPLLPFLLVFFFVALFPSPLCSRRSEVGLIDVGLIDVGSSVVDVGSLSSFTFAVDRLPAMSRPTGCLKACHSLGLLRGS